MAAAGRPSDDCKVDIVTIAARLDHKAPNIALAVYSHLFTKEDSAADDQIDSAIAELGIR